MFVFLSLPRDNFILLPGAFLSFLQAFALFALIYAFGVLWSRWTTLTEINERDGKIYS